MAVEIVRAGSITPRIPTAWADRVIPRADENFSRRREAPIPPGELAATYNRFHSTQLEFDLTARNIVSKDRPVWAQLLDNLAEQRQNYHEVLPLLAGPDCKASYRSTLSALEKLVRKVGAVIEREPTPPPRIPPQHKALEQRLHRTTARLLVVEAMENRQKTIQPARVESPVSVYFQSKAPSRNEQQSFVKSATALLKHFAESATPAILYLAETTQPVSDPRESQATFAEIATQEKAPLSYYTYDQERVLQLVAFIKHKFGVGPRGGSIQSAIHELNQDSHWDTDLWKNETFRQSLTDLELLLKKVVRNPFIQGFHRLRHDLDPKTVHAYRDSFKSKLAQRRGTDQSALAKVENYRPATTSGKGEVVALLKEFSSRAAEFRSTLGMWLYDQFNYPPNTNHGRLHHWLRQSDLPTVYKEVLNSLLDRLVFYYDSVWGDRKPLERLQLIIGTISSILVVLLIVKLSHDEAEAEARRKRFFTRDNGLGNQLGDESLTPDINTINQEKVDFIYP